MLSGPASAEIKMGVVNFQKLLEDAPQTKTAMQALESEFAPRRRELLTMQNDLKAIYAMPAMKQKSIQMS